MHNIGSTQTEFPADATAFEEEQFEFNEFDETADEYGFEGESILSPETESELAVEFLEIGSEDELDQFLGKLIKKVGRAAGRFIKSPLGRRLGGLLKGIVKKALPVAGAALGNLVVPGLGGVIGGKLASTAGSMFGLETEGLTAEECDYEVAKRVVRFAADAAKNAVRLPPGAATPQAIAQAVANAVRRHIPGALQQGVALAGGRAADGMRAGGRTGRWARRGGVIVLYGV